MIITLLHFPRLFFSSQFKIFEDQQDNDMPSDEDVDRMQNNSITVYLIITKSKLDEWRKILLEQ